MPTYYIDPVNGNDANAGDSFAAGHPFKTLKKTFAAGDTILIAKNVETGQAGTATATLGSASVTTTSDLSAAIPQYSIIRFDTDNHLYMVKAISSTVITLYRPYRGVTGSGKVVNKLTVPTMASDDWKPTAGTGTAASLITMQGGIDTGTLAQNGFTILGGNGASYGGDGTLTYWDVSRLGFYYFVRLWNYELVNSVLTDCYAFRAGTSFTYNTAWRNSTINGFVAEIAKYLISAYYCTINDLETGDSGSNGIIVTNFIGNTVNRWKNAGYVTYPALALTNSNAWLNRFNDCILDELASGCTGVYVNGSGGYYIDVTLTNPVVGSGTMFSVGAYSFAGRVGFQHINRSATDNREYRSPLYSSGYYYQVAYDGAVYNTAAPSAKVLLYQHPYPLTIAHRIPCEAGVEKTVSVYFRKNSSYGSVTLPTMRLRWTTGADNSLVQNVHDVTMENTNDTFLKQSYAVTPSVKGAIIMELIFQSAASGAIAWYDDIEVV